LYELYLAHVVQKNDDPEDSMQQCEWLTDIHNHSKKHCGNEDRACYGISM